MQNKKKNKSRWVLLLFATILVFAIATGVYLMDYYHASEAALSELDQPEESVEILREDGRIIFVPDHPLAGMVFYPGGKVAYESYTPLLNSLAENGILCVLTHMPGNLAVLDQNAADGIPEIFPEVTKWYLAGHSLGGTIAGIYLADHPNEYDGLILLASYSTADLSGADLKVLSVYGSEDGVMNRDAYEKNRCMLPPGAEEVVIQGGCHAFFGDYGEQEGDGTPTITQQEQQRQTVNEIVNFILS